jgi:hypothetical protein
MMHLKNEIQKFQFKNINRINKRFSFIINLY